MKVPAQSPSSLQTYLTCPRQYYAKYISKEVKFQQNAAAAFGEKVHKEIEDFLLARAELPQHISPMKPLLEALRGALVGAETKLAINKAGQPVEFFASDAYQRCIIDAIATNPQGTHIVCVDWKTGKKRDAQMQHDFLKKCALAHFPNAERVSTHFVYFYRGQSDKQEHRRGQPFTLLDSRMADLQTAYTTDSFPPTPNGLCKRYCDVLSCPHNGKHKE